MSIPNPNPDAAPELSATAAGEPDSAAPGRPFVGILFECCGVYQRIYRKAEVFEYRGRCPKCLRAVRLTVGPGGTSTRLFRAS